MNSEDAKNILLKRVNVKLIVTALKYYGRNHPEYRKEVKEELENWKNQLKETETP